MNLLFTLIFCIALLERAVVLVEDFLLYFFFSEYLL